MAVNFTVDLYESNNTTLVKTLDNAMFWGGEVFYELRGENDKFVFTVDPNHADTSQLLISRIVHLNHTDQNFSRRYRIFKVVRKRQGDKRFYEFTARALKFDLADQIHFASETIINQTPLTHINKILDGSGWTAGTITPATLITIEYRYNSRLADLEAVRDAVQERGPYELVFNDNMTVDLIIPGTNSTSTIEFRKNLLRIDRSLETPNANRIYGIGGVGNDGKPMTIAGATFRVVYIDANANTVALNSSKIYRTPRDWETYSLRKKGTNQTWLISTGNAFLDPNDNTVIPLDDPVTGLNPGDRVEIIKTSPPEPVGFVRNKESETNYGIIEDVFIDETFQDVENLAGPEKVSTLSGTYTSGIAEGWQAVGGGSLTLTENNNSAYVINGTKSQHVQVANYSTAPGAPTLTIAGAGPLSGTYNYKVAYVTRDGVGPASLVTSINTATNAVNVDLGSYPSDSHVIGAAIFRTKSGGTTYYLVGVTSKPVAIFYDNISDDKLTIDETSYIDANRAAGGQGIALPIQVEAGKPYSMVVYTIVLSGSIRLEVKMPDGTIFPDETLVSRGSTSVTTQTKITIIAQGISPVSSGTMEIRIVANEGAADFYVDSIMVVDQPYAPSPDRFYADSARKELWEATYDRLVESDGAKVAVSAGVSDHLYVLQTTNLLNVGDTVNVIDSDLGINDSVRIIGKSFRLLEPHRASYQLSFQKSAIPDIFTKTGYRLKSLMKGLQRSASTSLVGGTAIAANNPAISFIEE